MRGQKYFDHQIVGAGAAGLTAGYKLLKGDASVLLIERDDRIGGRAKSHENGGHVFDTGPKRFHWDPDLERKSDRSFANDCQRYQAALS